MRNQNKTFRTSIHNVTPLRHYKYVKYPQDTN